MLRLRSAFSLLVASVLACGGGDGGTEPEITAVSMTPSSATALTGTVGTAVSPAPAVKVVGSDGAGFEGTTVTFSVSGGGQVAETSVTTGATGVASAGTWTLGTAVGTQTVTATASGLGSVTFTATAGAGPAANIAIVSGTNQTATVGATAQPLVVAVTDQHNNPVGGTTVTFAVASGGGTLVGSGVATNTQGQATSGAWVLGTTPGSNSVTATVGSIAPVTFTATTTAGAAARITGVSGDGQTGDLGVVLGQPLTVKVMDAHGNAVAGAPVSFAVTGGTGVLGTPNVSTNAEGHATTTLSLSALGTAAVTATSGAVAGASVAFTASTGASVVGQVTVAPDVTRVLYRMAGAAAAARSAAVPSMHKASTKPRREPEGVQPVRLAGPDEIDTSRNLIVSFHKGAFSLPQDAMAYRGSAALRTDAAQAYYSALASLEASGRIQRGEVSPAIGAVRIDVMPGQDVEVVKQMLRSDPRVLAVEENVVVSSHAVRLPALPPVPVVMFASGDPAAAWLTAAAPSTELYPSDPLIDDQLWHYRMIDAPRAWKLTTGSNTVRVAVVDAGIRPDHPAITPLLAATGHYDFTDGTTVAYGFPQPICGTGLTFLTIRGTAADVAAPRNAAQAPNDLFVANAGATCWTRSTGGSHGTHVAGTVGSRANDAVGGTGVNWNVELIAVRTLGITGSGFTFDIVQGILYAAGLPATYTGAPFGTTVQMPAAHVMNLSLGGSTPTLIMQNAITAASANTLIIASAGNNSNSAANYPAAYPEAVSVVALAPDGNLASYTTVGSTVDIAAPGGDTGRYWSSAGVLSSTWNYQTSAPNYTFYQGTSMAAPHVTGVAALVFAMNPGLTPAQVRARLVNGAIDLFSPGHDNRSGAGLVNAYNAVTGTRGPSANTVVRAIDASTGTVARTAIAANGSFTLANLGAGSFHIVAAQDEGTDPAIGIPGRRMGWLGAPGMGMVTLNAPGTQHVAVTLGSPVESEPNDATGQANPLVVNSWVSGNLLAPDGRDMYVVRIPTAGTYTFETSGVLGACFSALEVDTVLRLLNQNGVTMLTNDDTASPAASYPGAFCSVISTQLQPGTYYLEVTPAGGDFGSYRLHVRAGS